MRERAGEPGDPLFPTSRGRALSRDAIALLVTKYATIAAVTCPTLRAKQVSPHTLRHYADGWVMCPAVAFPLLGAAELVLQSA